MLHRGLDATYPEEVRRRITLLTFARTAANGCFRFAPPFLATIASGLGVSLDTIGIAVAISELSGLVSPITGHLAERLHRRTAMAVGLTGVGAGAALAAGSHHVVMFAAALIVIAQSKVMFDLGLGAWISDRVAYERRGRALGLTETSWAMGLLLGVSAMGLVTAASSWRAAYLAGAVAVLAMAAAVSRTVAGDPAEGHEHARAPRPAGGLRVPTAGWMLVVAALCLMSSSQMLFVTFGSWLKDHHGFHDAGVAALAFGLGAGELFASLSAARFSDRWGKERAGATGALLMVPAAALLAVTHATLGLGLPALVVAIAAFEFAIVSIIPLGTQMVTGAPAFGMSVMLAAGTLGRALASIPATRLYTREGMAWPAVLCAVLAACCALALRGVAVLRRR